MNMRRNFAALLQSNQTIFSPWQTRPSVYRLSSQSADCGAVISAVIIRHARRRSIYAYYCWNSHSQVRSGLLLTVPTVGRKPCFKLRQTQVLRRVTMPCWDCRCVQHRFFLESLHARDKRPNRQNQQRLHATLEEDSALQRIEASPRGKSRSGALNRLSKPELQQELRLRGLSDNGKKEALKARLTDSLDLDNPAAGISRDLLYQAAYNLHTTKVNLVEV